jgi:hypothetical protein
MGILKACRALSYAFPTGYKALLLRYSARELPPNPTYQFGLEVPWWKQTSSSTSFFADGGSYVVPLYQSLHFDTAMLIALPSLSSHSDAPSLVAIHCTVTTSIRLPLAKETSSGGPSIQPSVRPSWNLPSRPSLPVRVLPSGSCLRRRRHSLALCSSRKHSAVSSLPQAVCPEQLRLEPSRRSHLWNLRLRHEPD